MSTKPTFPDPNRTLDDYHADVEAYGTIKANWWRLIAPVAIRFRQLQYSLVRRICRSLANSRTTPASMKVSLADLAHWLDGARLNTIRDVVKACRMLERVRRGDD